MVNEKLEITDNEPDESTATVTRVDFGCGSNKKEGFIGCDNIAFDGVDVVIDIGKDPWPWPDNSVDEGHASHFLEHLNGLERVHFFNELYRVLKPGGQCTIITPYWGSTRAYGDFTHAWPPVSEMLWYYLKSEWRNGKEEDGVMVGANAPHTDIKHNPLGYSCDFEAGWGYSMSAELSLKSQDAQMFAIQNYLNAAQDMQCTVTAIKSPLETTAKKD